MGFRFEVWAWTYAPRLGIGPETWHYAELYQGDSLVKALWKALRARREYGCVKVKMR